jgi:hypothetical protein
MQRDLCKGVRETYNSLLKVLSVNDRIAFFLSGFPIYFISFFLIGHNIKEKRSNALSYPSYIILIILGLTWLLAGFTIFKKLPNLLTVSIFIYKCIGHWSLVSSLILVFYGVSILPRFFITYLISGLFPLIVLLFLCGDIMRTIRTRMYTLFNETGTNSEIPRGLSGSDSVAVNFDESRPKF